MKKLNNLIVHCASSIVHQSKTLTLLLVMLLSVNVWGDTYSWTCSGTTTFSTSGAALPGASSNSVKWKASTTGSSNGTGVSGEKCVQISAGSGLTLTTSDISGTISSIVIQTWGSKGNKLTCSVGTTYSSSKNISTEHSKTNNSLTTFDNINASGTITLTWESATKSLSVRQINITYTSQTTLSFDLNNGSGTKPGDITSFPATLPSTDGFTRSGYRPNGWNTQADGKGTDYADGESFSAPAASVKLYVKWMPVYTVTYNGNNKTSGSVPVDNNSPYDENRSVTVLGNTGNLARTGYTWSGWNGNTSGTGTEYVVGNSFKITSNTTLYAKWTANQTIITLSAPNADISEGTTQVTATYDKAMPTATMPQRTGYTFNGYFDAESGGTKYYSNTGSSANKWNKDFANYTLYAQWIAKQYTITYKNQGGGTFSGQHESGYPTKHTYDQTTPLKTATRTGYDFGGWYESEDCSGSPIETIGGQAKTDNFTLYAKWTARTTTVSFDKNTTDDVQNMPAGTITNTFDAALTTTGVTIPTRIGYTFVGWFDSSSKEYYGVTDNAITASVNKWDKAEENITLWAHWTPQVYTITYLDKGGTIFTGTHDANYPKQHTYGTPTNLDSPTKANFDFVGWYINSDCSGEPLTSLAADEYLAPITLYAKWNEHDKYTVTFVDDVQGTNCSSWDMKDTYVNTQIVFHSIGDKTRKAPDGDCVTDHYHFVGWVEEGTTPTKEPDNVIKAGTTSIKITKNVTYKAVWAKEL